MHRGMVAITLFGVAGCSNPIVGKWTTKVECGTETVEFEGDETGTVSGSAKSLDGDCFPSKCDLTWEDHGDKEYDVDVNCIGDAGAAGLSLSCKIDDDTDPEELRCTPGSIIYKRAD